MSKYYDKELPTEIHFIYGERRAGVTYREFEKLKNENEMLRDSWDDMFHKWETQVQKIGKAIKYIEDDLIPYGDEWHWDDGAIREYVISLLKILKGEK